MKTKDEIKGNLTLKGWTLTEIVNEINRRRKGSGLKKTSVSNVSNKINRGTIKYDEVKEIADIIGCSLEWRDK